MLKEGDEIRVRVLPAGPIDKPAHREVQGKKITLTTKATLDRELAQALKETDDGKTRVPSKPRKQLSGLSIAGANAPLQIQKLLDRK